MAHTTAKARAFTVADYAKMIDTGVLGSGERVELIEGTIVAMAAHNPRHSLRIASLTTLFTVTFYKTHYIRVQLPLTLGATSEPEPDFAIVPIGSSQTPARHPTGADLVLEVSDSSFRFDRHEKSSLYAKAGITDYWILNLRRGKLEVRRSPEANSQGAYGWDYGNVQILTGRHTIAPLFRPDCIFTVEQLLS